MKSPRKYQENKSSPKEWAWGRIMEAEVGAGISILKRTINEWFHKPEVGDFMKFEGGRSMVLEDWKLHDVKEYICLMY